MVKGEWASEDIEKLRRMNREGASVSEMATVLQRTSWSVRYKMEDLNLTIPKNYRTRVEYLAPWHLIHRGPG